MVSGKPGLPFALLVLGGQFAFSAVKGLMREIVAGTVWRIMIAPLLGIGGAMGSDEQLATQLVVWTSLLSILTIFAQVCALMSIGLLVV